MSACSRAVEQSNSRMQHAPALQALGSCGIDRTIRGMMIDGQRLYLEGDTYRISLT
jgi:hypothetical protein